MPNEATTKTPKREQTKLVVTHIHEYDAERLVEAHLFVLRLGKERAAAWVAAKATDKQAA